MLQAPGNSYDGDTEDETADEVDEGYLPPAPYLPAILDEKQRFRKIGNYLTKLKSNGKIHLGPGKVWMPGPEK